MTFITRICGVVINICIIINDISQKHRWIFATAIVLGVQAERRASLLSEDKGKFPNRPGSLKKIKIVENAHQLDMIGLCTMP